MRKSPTKNRETALKEQYRHEILEKLFSLTEVLRQGAEKTVVSEILLNDLTIAECSAKLCLTQNRIKKILQGSIARVKNRLDRNFEAANSYSMIKKELDVMRQAQIEKDLKETESTKMPVLIIQLLDKNLNSFPFSNRVSNIFERAEIVKVADLVKYSVREFGGLRGSGKKSIAEIENFFIENDISWRML